jgi:hypothetical protein
MPDLSPKAQPQVDEEREPRSVVNSAPRVTVAFPFSAIKIEDPSDDLRALAVLVRDLADALTRDKPVNKKTAKGLRARAQALADHLV